MYTFNLIRKKQSLIDKIISWVFILSGANFYLNWILITNPQSKNIAIRFCWCNTNKARKYMNSPEVRYKMAFGLGSVHIIGAVIHLFTHRFWGASNILVNLYPIVVQLYVGYRCFAHIKRKKELKLKRQKIHESFSANRSTWRRSRYYEGQIQNVAK